MSYCDPNFGAGGSTVVNTISQILFGQYYIRDIFVLGKKSLFVEIT